MRVLLILILLTCNESRCQLQVTLSLNGPSHSVDQGSLYTINCAASIEGIVDDITLTINGQSLAIGGFAFGGNPNRSSVNYFNPEIRADNNGQVAQCHYNSSSGRVSSNHLVILVSNGTERSVVLTAPIQNAIRDKEFTFNCTLSNITLAISDLLLRINADPVMSRASVRRIDSTTSSFTLANANNFNGAVAQCTVGEFGSNPFVINVAEQDCGNTGSFECEQLCTNFPRGGFMCSCTSGYVQDGTQCKDIDECLVKNGECDQICINTDGSRACFCEEGFFLKNDGISCGGSGFTEGNIATIAVVLPVGIILIIGMICSLLGVIYLSRRRKLLEKNMKKFKDSFDLMEKELDEMKETTCIIKENESKEAVQITITEVNDKSEECFNGSNESLYSLESAKAFSGSIASPKSLESSKVFLVGSDASPESPRSPKFFKGSNASPESPRSPKCSNASPSKSQQFNFQKLETERKGSHPELSLQLKQYKSDYKHLKRHSQQVPTPLQLNDLTKKFEFTTKPDVFEWTLKSLSNYLIKSNQDLATVSHYERLPKHSSIELVSPDKLLQLTGRSRTMSSTLTTINEEKQKANNPVVCVTAPHTRGSPKLRSPHPLQSSISSDDWKQHFETKKDF